MVFDFYSKVYTLNKSSQWEHEAESRQIYDPIFFLGGGVEIDYRLWLKMYQFVSFFNKIWPNIWQGTALRSKWVLSNLDRTYIQSVRLVYRVNNNEWHFYVRNLEIFLRTTSLGKTVSE